MALLQISEPGESPAPHQRKLAVGIDLGTTNSLVAAVRSSVAEVLPDAQGHALLPSAVRYFADGKVTTGRGRWASRPRIRGIPSRRRSASTGRSLEEARAMRAPYELVDAPGMVRIRTAQGDLSPVEVSAQIQAVLRQRAEDVLGDDLVGAVITVPAYFDDAQRQATARRGSPGRAERAAAAERSPPRRRSPTAWTTRPKASTQSMTWAAALSIFPSCA